MKKLLTVLVGVIGFQSLTIAQDPNLEALEKDATVVPGSADYRAIYDTILRNGFLNNAGHSMAAAVLSTCRVADTADVRLRDFADILNTMSHSRFRAISSPNPRSDARITYAAATLVCKMGTHSAVQIVKQLELIYGTLINCANNPQGAVSTDWPPNVVVAAHMLNADSALPEVLPDDKQPPEVLPDDKQPTVAP